MKEIPVRGEILISYHLYFTKTDLKQRDTQLSNNKPYYLSHKRNGVLCILFNKFRSQSICNLNP